MPTTNSFTGMAILYMRTFTPVVNNELGTIKYGRLDELKMGLIRDHMAELTALTLFFFFGLVALAIHVINREHESNLYFALFSLLIGHNIIGNAIKFTAEGSVEATAERTGLGWAKIRPAPYHAISSKATGE